MNIFNVLRRNKELESLFDLDLFQKDTEKTAMKKVAIETVIGMITRTVIQSEFRIKKNKQYQKNGVYYKLNIKPNKNQSSSEFWAQVVYKLLYDGECLIIKTDEDDLLVADDFMREEYAVHYDKFHNVIARNYEFKRVFERKDVIYLKYGNDELSKLVDSLYDDYGDLFGRMVEYQKRKNQIRATVDIDTTVRKSEDGTNPLQIFIDKAYRAIRDNAVAIIPQQKGFKYEEHSRQATSGQNIDEINKITDGFLTQVANAVGLPIALLRGDMADVEKITRNYMQFCIDPILTVVEDELNRQLVTQKEYLNGTKIDVRRITHRNIFDIATAIDKLISSGVFNGNEIRDEVGYEMTDEDIHKNYFITKNYQESSEAIGGDG